jgi:O-antigen ligase
MRLGLQNGLPEISTNLIPVITVVAFVFGLHLMFRTRFTAARILLSLALLILAAATVSTQSRAAVISLFTAAAVILFFRNRVAMIVCLAVLLSLSSLAYLNREKRHEFSEIGSIERNVRISLALMAGGILEDYPITGIGFGTNIFGERIDHEKYNSKLPQAYQLSDTNLKGHTKEPHSMYTSIAIRTGLPGFGFFLLFVGAFLLNGIRLMRSENDEAKEVSHCLFAAMVGMLIVGLFERCLSPITDMVFYTVVAMEGILIRIDKEQMTS